MEEYLDQTISEIRDALKSIIFDEVVRKDIYLGEVTIKVYSIGKNFRIDIINNCEDK